MPSHRNVNETVWGQQKGGTYATSYHRGNANENSKPKIGMNLTGLSLPRPTILGAFQQEVIYDE